MATEKTIKEPIRIRQKELANGNISLYLDIYRRLASSASADGEASP